MSSLREKLIKASLLHVRTCGFSQNAIMEGCHFLGLSSSAKDYLPNKEMDLIHHVLQDSYARSLTKVSEFPNSIGQRWDSEDLKNLDDSGQNENADLSFENGTNKNSNFENNNTQESNFETGINNYSEENLGFEDPNKNGSFDYSYSDYLEDAEIRKSKAKLKLGLEEYIMGLALYSEHWDDAMFQLVKPLNLQTSLSMLHGYTQSLQQMAISQTLADDPTSSINNILCSSLYFHANLCGEGSQRFFMFVLILFI